MSTASDELAAGVGWSIMQRRITITFAFLLSSTILGCGNGELADDEGGPLATSHAALCAGAPERHGEVVTRIGCPFEQHARNISVYGDQLEPQLIVDASGRAVATVTAACDSYWLGTDMNGVSVILDAKEGHVLSHGTVHPGLATSELPNDLPAPFALK